MVRTWVVPVIASALLVATAAPAQAAPAGWPGPRPGAPGVGDPYFPLDGNGGYDVVSYDLDVAYRPQTDELAGQATITATATQGLLSFDLDLDDLTVSAVSVDGAAARWYQVGGELVVVPRHAVGAGRRFEVVVLYSGVPQTIDDAYGTSGFLHTDDGALVVGQPAVASTWFPVNDHPSDAATYDLTVTVPAGSTAVSNGVLVGTEQVAGSSVWHWRADDPMASYLLTLAIGEFDLTTGQVGGTTYLDALDPDLDDLVLDPQTSTASVGEVARTSLARQPEVLGFLADRFGPYPFTQAGGIVDDDPALGFALENQTRPVYSPLFFTDTVSGDSVVVHELAHQWFGDDVRLAAWQHIWLNEGPATYAEWLWAEREGLQSVQDRFDELAAIPADDPFWTVRPGDPGPEGLFDEPVYLRGAMTLHALRAEVGDEAFWTILRTWVSRYSGQAVDTADFTALAEEVACRDLDGFFRTWLTEPRKPAGLPAPDVTDRGGV